MYILVGFFNDDEEFSWFVCETRKYTSPFIWNINGQLQVALHLELLVQLLALNLGLHRIGNKSSFIEQHPDFTQKSNLLMSSYAGVNINLVN